MNDKHRLLIRLYAPSDPWHRRETYYDYRRESREFFVQIAIGEWALMVGWFGVFSGKIDFFMYVKDT